MMILSKSDNAVLTTKADMSVRCQAQVPSQDRDAPQKALSPAARRGGNATRSTSWEPRSNERCGCAQVLSVLRGVPDAGRGCVGDAAATLEAPEEERER